MFFCQESVKCLRHVVSKDGIQTDPDKIENRPRPNNADDLLLLSHDITGIL